MNTSTATTNPELRDIVTSFENLCSSINAGLQYDLETGQDNRKVSFGYFGNYEGIGRDHRCFFFTVLGKRSRRMVPASATTERFRAMWREMQAELQAAGIA